MYNPDVVRRLILLTAWSLVACGRIGFQLIGEGPGGDGGPVGDGRPGGDGSAGGDGATQTPHVVQATSATPTGTTLTVPFVSNVTAGDVVVVELDLYTGATITSVTDTRGSSYMLAVSAAPLGRSMSLYYAVLPAGGPDTISVTFSASVTTEVRIHEISGLAAVSPLDGASATGATALVASLIAGAPITTTTPNDLVFATVGGTGPHSAGAGFTAVLTTSFNVSEYAIVPTPSTITAPGVMTAGGDWFIATAAFHPGP
jgi:hypothetical protein